MKKTFCDCCGEEIDYESKTQNVLGKNDVEYIMANPEPVGINPGRFQIIVSVTPLNRQTGKHVDVCGECVWFMLNKMDPRDRPMAEVRAKLHNIPESVVTKHLGPGSVQAFKNLLKTAGIETYVILGA